MGLSEQSRGRVCAGARMRQPLAARGVPCGAQPHGPPRNSLHSLRSLRSNSLGESEHEARCARGHEPCAPRRRICRCRRTPAHGFADAPSGLNAAPATVVPARLWVGRPVRAWRAPSSAADQGASRRRTSGGATASMSRSERSGAAQQRRGHARPRGGAALGAASSAGDLGPQGRGARGSAHRPAHPQPCSLNLTRKKSKRAPKSPFARSDNALQTSASANQSKPAPRAHLYFAPSTATGISVEYA